MKFSTVIAAAALSLAGGAHAVVVVDQSPDVVGFTNDFSASNVVSQQSFFVQFTLGSATTLTGMDIYSSYAGSGFVNVGDAVVVRFRNDVGGAPDPTTNIASFATTIAAIDNVGSSTFPSLLRISADFSGLALGPGTYWASLAGVAEIGWSLDPDQSYPTWQVFGEQTQFFRDWYAPFRLESDAVIPEPASWALMIAGFGLVGASLRRRGRHLAA